MNPVIEGIYSTGLVTDREGNTREAFPTSLPRQDGEALYRCVTRLQAKRTLEIGFAFGVSTLFICQALHDMGGGRHIAIDPFEDVGYGDIGLANIERAGFNDLFTFHLDYSQDLLPQFLMKGEKFDFIFVDGHHTFDHIFMDFFYTDKLINPGGHIMFHDAVLPATRKVVAYILRNLHYKLDMDEELVRASRLGALYQKMRMVWHNPLEPFTIEQSAVWSQVNYCILQKQADDDRKSNDYVPF